MTHFYALQLASILIICFIHRPFISKIELIKYIALGCISFVAAPPLLFMNYNYNEEIIEAENIIPATSQEVDQLSITSNLLISSTATAATTATTVASFNFYEYLFIYAIKYSLISIFTVSITCLFTRWHFPITSINPTKNNFVLISRYVVSFLFFILAGILCQQSTPSNYHMLLSCTAAVIGALWFIAGPYFMKRWKAITIICIISNIFTITGYTTNYDHDTAATDDFYYCVLHWSFIILALVLSCNTLDYLDAILNTFPHLLDISKMDQEKYQNPYTTTYWIALFRLVFIVVNEKSLKKLNASPIDDLQTAIKILGPASRSWKTMAALFPVNLRQDLCLLYAFFRTADDLVDDAATPEQGERNLLIIRMFLQDVFSPSSSTTTTAAAIKLEEQVTQDKTLPPHIDWNQYAALLPYNSDVLAIFRNFARISHYLCPRAMSELTNAWEHDLEGRPATKEQDLLNYAAQISGTFGELCTCVIMYKTGRGNWGTSSYNDPEATKVLSRARSTGQCLQLINVARDIITDSLVGRCYVPLEYMPSPEIYNILTKSKNPHQVGEHVLKSFSLGILDLADKISNSAQKGIDGLPTEVQNSIRAAFQIYMAIGTTLRNTPGYPTRAKVPKWKQQWIALCCIYGFNKKEEEDACEIQL